MKKSITKNCVILMKKSNMLTIIIFSVLVLATYIFNLVFFWGELSFGYITNAMIFSVLIEVGISGLIATFVCKILPDKWFSDKVKIFDVSKREVGFYVNVLKIKKWKDKTLELGQLNGFKKDKLDSDCNIDYLKKFVIECNCGFIGHLFSIILGSLIIFWYPKAIMLTMGVPTIIINFIINYMSVAILRFNIPRLKTAIKFAERKNKSSND